MGKMNPSCFFLKGLAMIKAPEEESLISETGLWVVFMQ